VASRPPHPEASLAGRRRHLLVGRDGWGLRPAAVGPASGGGRPGSPAHHRHRGRRAEEEEEEDEEGLTPLAARLARRLRADPDPAFVRAIDAALVLLADHELATSALAVRVAASTRADLYDATLAGLGTLGGPWHGGASEVTFAMLAQARRETVESALTAALRWQRSLPGFGHAVYEGGDPRCATLLGYVEPLASPEDRRLLSEIIELAAQGGIVHPNVDFALAALMLVNGLSPDAGRAIFSVARMAGWTAHYLEELDERPLRFRARAVYASPGGASTVDNRG
jgi:citrate synthase